MRLKDGGVPVGQGIGLGDDLSVWSKYAPCCVSCMMLLLNGLEMTSEV